MKVGPGPLLLSFAVGFAFCGAHVRGQVSRLPTRVEPRLATPAVVPFGPGEKLTYDVRLGALGRRGQGHMEVVGLETVRGRTAYHVSMAIQGGLLFAKVDDHYQSWFDVTDLVTLRFIQDVDEINYERYRHWEIFPEERRFRREDSGREGEIPTHLPLDDVSFLYFVRTLPLEVGDEYSFDRYFREGGNPVVIRVLRKDSVTVPAGTFETLVVQPIIQTDGLFSQGGEAEVHFSNDPRRLLVLMRSKVPLVGALSLHLRTITEGRPIQAPGGLPNDPDAEWPGPEPGGGQGP